MKQERRTEAEAGQTFLKRVTAAAEKAAATESGHSRLISQQIIDGTIKALETKITLAQKENDLEKATLDRNEAYNQQRHLMKIREELNRKNDVKKAQELNKRVMEKMKTSDPEFQDRKLVQKVGITQDTSQRVERLQANSPVGGNAYFIANEAQFKRDQQRRVDRMTAKHELTVKSPIKNHALAYDHERSKLLSDIEQKRIA